VKKSGKKRIGRPPGRKAPRRPVLSARVPEDFYLAVKEAAQRSGRTMSEELVWRARQTINVINVPPGHFLDSDGQVAPYPSDPNKPIKSGNIRERMRTEGFVQLPDYLGGFWVEPNVSPSLIKEILVNELRAVLKDAVREGLAQLAEAKEDKSG
jgi:hypothetical protein